MDTARVNDCGRAEIAEAPASDAPRRAEIAGAPASDAPRRAEIALGVVLRRRPGVTRWAKWSWQAIGAIPGAAATPWRLLREEAGVTDLHAATPPLALFRTDIEGYRVALAMTPPSLFVVLRAEASAPHGMRVHAVTASAFEAQDHLDNAEDQVDPVPMPPEIAEAVRAFVTAHHVDTEFRKRRRDNARVDLVEDGVGDARIRQAADVYRAPQALKPRAASGPPADRGDGGDGR